MQERTKAWEAKWERGKAREAQEAKSNNAISRARDEVRSLEMNWVQPGSERRRVKFYLFFLVCIGSIYKCENLNEKDDNW